MDCALDESLKQGGDGAPEARRAKSVVCLFSRDMVPPLPTSIAETLSIGYLIVAAALIFLLLIGVSFMSPCRRRALAVKTTTPSPTRTELPLAPSPAPASPELRSGSIGVLPCELLLLIFGHFHERHLMHIISLVCKRWRRAVLPCVKHIRFVSGEWVQAHVLLSQATRVSEVTLSTRHDIDLRYKFVLPPTTTRLNSMGLRSQNLENHLVVPPLRELRVPADALEPLAFVLMHSRNSLATLHITSGVSHPVDQLLTNLHLPSLSALKAPPNFWHMTTFLPFFSRHASQLTTLEIVGKNTAASLLIPFFTHEVPNLRRLSMSYMDVNALSLASFLRSAPQLTELAVRNVPAIFRQPLSLLTSLVACSTTELSSRFSEAKLAALPRLRKIAVPQPLHPRVLLALHPPTLLRITHVRLRVDFKSAAGHVSMPLGRTPSLEKLSVVSYFPDWCLSSVASLPRLRVLKVDHRQVANLTYEQLVAPISGLVALAPRLERVCVTFGKGAVDHCVLGSEAPLCALVQALVQRRCAFEGQNLSPACAQEVRACCTPWDDVKLL